MVGLEKGDPLIESLAPIPAIARWATLGVFNGFQTGYLQLIEWIVVLCVYVLSLISLLIFWELKIQYCVYYFTFFHLKHLFIEGERMVLHRRTTENTSPA